MNFKRIIFIIFILFLCVNIFAQNSNSIFSKYKDNKKVQQIVCVSCVAASNAILKMYIRDKNETSGWKLILSTDAFIGKNGIKKQKEGDLKTPTGEFNIIKAFGIKENPGTKLKYIKINKNIYACDEDCKYYNQIIDTSKVKHNCKGEHIIDYKPQYNYALSIDYNKENIYPSGSNIFIHVKGNKSYTAGCIAIDEDSMKTLLKNSTKKTKVIIR